MQTMRALGSRYTLIRVLGSGAMGEVWLAHDADGTQLAAKLLRRELAEDPVIVGRFVQERSILLELDHPHLVRVRDLVVEGDALALVMDLVDGGDLRVRLKESGPLPPAEAVTIAACVLDALAAAHAKGILHRDVKPDNVLVDGSASPRPGWVRLTDFGIARLAQETTVRMTGVLGTAEYIAPEVFTNETVSAAADVYGAGILLYELLAGITPFAGDGTSYAVANRHVTAAPPPIPGVPGPVWDVISHLLDKDPKRRPDAAAAAAALRSLVPMVAGLAPLPALGKPAQWTPSADPGAGGGAGPAAGVNLAVKGYQPGEALVDPHRTSIRRGLLGPIAPQAPVQDGTFAPAVQAAPAAGAVAGPDGGTQIRDRRVRPTPVDAALPAAPANAGPARSGRRTALVVAGVAAVIAAVVVAVLVLGGAKKSPVAASGPAANAGPATVTGQASSETTAIGLSISRTASYDPAAKLVTMSIQYGYVGAGGSALAGPFFESLPLDARTRTCVVASWSRAASPDATTPGIDPADCGYQLQLALRSGSSVTATYTSAVTTAPTADTLSSLAAAETSRTDASLARIKTGAVYAAQRLTGITATVLNSPAVHDDVHLVVEPQWTSGAADAVDLLFDSDNGGPQPAVLVQLGGSVRVDVGTCSGAVTQSGYRFTANEPTSAGPCALEASLGSLTVPTSDFSVLVSHG